MRRRIGFAALVLSAAVLLVSSRGPDVSADPAVTGLPDSIAALGDSITRAANSDAFGDQPANSWATGTNPAVNSVYSRILALNPGISGNAFNDSVSGARMTHLDGQAVNAVAQGAGLVVVLMGANDVCQSSEATMTPVATFQAQFEAAMATLSAGLPDSTIAVGSIPDIFNLWDILHTDSTATARWQLFSICQAMLANPTSMALADVTRRANVRQRNIDFNSALESVCAQYVHCRFDQNGGFNMAFTPAHVSTLDYFHPSVAGEALAAGVAWDAFPDPNDATAPVSDSVGAAAAGGATVTLSATDAGGVSGIEYRTNAGAWQRDAGPLFHAGGTLLEWRAVDINGNTEASRACVVRSWSWPAGDTDCDGLTDTAEAFVGTQPQVQCAATPASNDEPTPDAWPYDMNDSQSANLVDILQYVGKLNYSDPNPLYVQRFDLNNDGGVNLVDVLKFIPFLNKSCAP